MPKSRAALELFRAQGPLCSADLAGLLDRADNYVTALVSSLLKSGYIARAGRRPRPDGRPAVHWAITPAGEARLDSTQVHLQHGALPHQVLACLHGEGQTARDVWARVSDRYDPEVGLDHVKSVLAILRTRGLSHNGEPQPVPGAPAAHTYLLTPLGETTLSRLPLLTRRQP